MTLSPRQEAALYAIGRFIESQGYAPTERELADMMSISRTAARKHLRALEAKGAIRRGGTCRSIAVVAGVQLGTFTESTKQHTIDSHHEND